jgi:pimeloyl-ACP methyl ester carboxylesterase
VFAPTLTGVGERSHLLSKDINLDTHINDIVNVIKWEDLRDVCLVAHSYGGWPGTGVVEQALDRISSVVWIDAFMPKDGQRGIDFVSEASRQALLNAVEKGEAGRAPPKAESCLFKQKVTGAIEKVAKKTYIRAVKFAQPAFDKTFAQCKADKSWQTHEATASGHAVMIDAPDWLADILLRVS